MPARAENIVFCRLALSGLARSHNVDQEVIDDMKLALTEACSNSVRHAYQDGGGEVSVRIELDDERIAIEVEDAGDGFTVAATPAVPPGVDRGGMGLALIRALSDELAISPGPDGHGSVVRFSKNI
jgi:serine/threonine-protein kinase RsbW